jgi:thiamine biosynthesis lipoprotein
MRLFQLALLAIPFVLFAPGCGEKKIVRYSYDKLYMSTHFEVVIYTSKGESFANEAAYAGFAEAARLDKKFSTTDPESLITRLNRNGGGELDPETAEILSTSAKFYHMSGELFDVTVLPLVRLWGFIDEQYRLPATNEIRETLNKVSFTNVIIENGKVTLKNGAMLDFGAIAKGFAIDKLVQVLQSNGISSGLVNAGGNLQVFGDKPDGTLWKIGIKNPREDGKIYQTVELKSGLSIATSGDYERFFITNGIRYHHILNPKTGWSMRNGVASVSVIVGNGELSDVLSTSLFLLGPDKGIGYAESNRLPVLYIMDTNGQLQERKSSFWQAASMN